jgi:hypothetical protein
MNNAATADRVDLASTDSIGTNTVRMEADATKSHDEAGIVENTDTEVDGASSTGASEVESADAQAEMTSITVTIGNDRIITSEDSDTFVAAGGVKSDDANNDRKLGESTTGDIATSSTAISSADIVVGVDTVVSGNEEESEANNATSVVSEANEDEPAAPSLCNEISAADHDGSNHVSNDSSRAFEDQSFGSFNADCSPESLTLDGTSLAREDKSSDLLLDRSSGNGSSSAVSAAGGS